MYIRFLNSNVLYEGSVSVSGNVATLKFKDKDVPVNTNGFDVFKDIECLYNLGGDFYKAFTTLYRNDESTETYNGYQLSNDGSVYVKPLRRVTFNASVGGSLDGNTVQDVYNYEDLIIPTPIADTDYEFTEWVPEIPASGEIDTNKSYTATFTSLLPPPEPEPTLEERVSAVEEQNLLLSETVDSVLVDVIPGLLG